MSNVRTYLVKETVGDSIIERLVDAKSDTKALNHVIEPKFAVSVATKDDLKRLLPNGVEIETAAE